MFARVPTACLAALLAMLIAFTERPAMPQEARPEPALREKLVRDLTRLCAEAQGIASVAVIDLATGDRFGVAEEVVYPQASAIKITILMEVFKQAAEGKIDLNKRIAVTDAVKAGGSGIIDAFGNGTSEIAVRDLAVLMIVLSDNTATNMLIELAGMANINATMHALGAKNTHLRRVMMDVKSSVAGIENVSTPADAAVLMELLHKRAFVNAETSEAILKILRLSKGGNIKDGLDSGVALANKPGGIPGVATEWAIVELEGRPYVLVTMAKFGPAGEGSDVTKKMSALVFSYFSRLARSTPYGALMDASLWQRR